MELNEKIVDIEKRFTFEVDELKNQLADVRKQVDVVDLRTQRGIGAWSTTSMDFAREAVQKLAEYRGSFDANARVRFEVSNPILTRVSRPATLPSAGSATIGTADFAPLSELLSAIPVVSVDAPSVVAVRESTSSVWGASPQAEGAVKYEANPVFESEVLPIRTIATWISATRQILDDVPGCEAFLRSRLEQALLREVERQVLLGSGTGESLKGLLVQASVWTPPTFAFDLIGGLMHATMIVRQRGFNPSIVVVSPQDELRLRLIRDLNGQYVTPPSGLPRVIPCAAMTSGQFLVADTRQVVLRTKQALTVDISEHHSDYFVRNQIAIRCEMRAALVCYSPRSLLKGTLMTSPAS
jgi:HK97 family phage major capsid protein